MISSNILTINSWIRSAAPLADVIVICSTKGQVLCVQSSSEFHTAELKSGMFILDMFKSYKEPLTQSIEDLLNNQKSNWLTMNCPGKEHALDWRLSTVVIENKNYILLQGHHCNRQLHSELDPLTGLPSRDAFFEKLKELALPSGYVCVVDIRKFKDINQTYGIACGNEVLNGIVSLAYRVFKQARIIARLGDDQFCIVGDSSYTEEIKQFIADLDSPVYCLGQLIKVDAYIGSCAFPETVSTLNEAFEGAMFALQAYKDSDENQLNRNWQFSSNDYRKKLRAQKLKDLIGPAINKNEFYLLYQPIVDADKNIVAVEALMRWNSSEEGPVSPAEFIPIAENNPQHILTLGSWALRRACSDIAALPSSWGDLKVSVNVSPVQFKKPEFLQDVRDILRLTGLSANRLQLEITEGVLVSNPKAGALMLTRLKEMGITIAIDDFGIGYSSLSYLKDFSLDTLKIDKSFVDDIVSSKKNNAICASIIDMSNRLVLKSTAEGIESLDQFSALKELGCKSFQGYFFGKPQVLKDLLKLG